MAWPGDGERQVSTPPQAPLSHGLQGRGWEAKAREQGVPAGSTGPRGARPREDDLDCVTRPWPLPLHPPAVVTHDGPQGVGPWARRSRVRQTRGDTGAAASPRSPSGGRGVWVTTHVRSGVCEPEAPPEPRAGRGRAVTRSQPTGVVQPRRAWSHTGVGGGAWMRPPGPRPGARPSRAAAAAHPARRGPR